MPRLKPTIKVARPANAYAGPRERIYELSSPTGRGGLISVRTAEDGSVSVHLYRLDEGVTVTEDPKREPRR